MIEHCEKVLVKDKTDINAMKELTAKLSAMFLLLQSSQYSQNTHDDTHRRENS